MKPIESRCLAIIINDEDVSNIGKEVRVVEFAPNATEKTGRRMWKVISKRPMTVFKESTQRSRKTCKGICFEDNLMRIDGGEIRDVVDKRINFLEILKDDEREVDWTKLQELPEPEDEREVNDAHAELDRLCDNSLDKEIDQRIKDVEREVDNEMLFAPGVVVRIIDDELSENIGKRVRLRERPVPGRWFVPGIKEEDLLKAWLVEPIDPIAIRKPTNPEEILYVSTKAPTALFHILFLDKNIEVVRNDHSNL